MAYSALLIVENRHTNPVMLVFCHLLMEPYVVRRGYKTVKSIFTVNEHYTLRASMRTTNTGMVLPLYPCMKAKS